MVTRREDTSTGPSIGESVETKLRRIADKARKDPKCQFTSLFHLMTEDLLRGCFQRLRGDAAAGIDRVTKEVYGKDLEANLTKLVERLHRMAYVPQDVRRVYIPKPGSDKQRPLGIPCLEDKLVQSALVRILEPIYEADFVEDSYGFRPKRGCHDALRALSRTVEGGKVNWIVEADIKGFFCNVSHDWMSKFLAHRVADKRVQRMVRRFMKAGIMEDGVHTDSAGGVPQGGSISPLLANMYLHYALDLWFDFRFRKTCSSPARLIRYADDFVGCFATQEDAERFHAELAVRLKEFGLEVEPSKTKVLAFGPREMERVKRDGGPKPETFDFLGFTHYCSVGRDGRRFRMKRRTARKKLRAKLAEYKAWIKSARACLTNREIWNKTCEKLSGHFAYYGVSDNYPSLANFLYQIRRILFKWLNRQGGRRRMNWDKFGHMAQRFPFPRPRIRVKLF